MVEFRSLDLDTHKLKSGCSVIIWEDLFVIGCISLEIKL